MPALLRKLAIVAAVDHRPVLIVVDGLERELVRVEARTDGRLVLHADVDIVGYTPPRAAE